jgi:competence protein ComEC
MVDWGRGRGRSETWPPGGAARRPRALPWPDIGAGFLGKAADKIRGWAIADAGPGRLLPWLPVAFGFGIAVYFAAEREPAWWAASLLAGVCCAIAFVARRRPVAFPILLALTAAAAGFAAATLKSLYVSHPILAGA